MLIVLNVWMFSKFWELKVCLAFLEDGKSRFCILQYLMSMHLVLCFSILQVQSTEKLLQILICDCYLKTLATSKMTKQNIT